MVISKLRGHEIEKRDGKWFYCDTGRLVEESWKDRSCGYCGMSNTPEGHDGCLGSLPDVANACCGHGETNEAYVQFNNGTAVYGFDAKHFIEGKPE